MKAGKSPKHEVRAINAARVTGKADDEIKALVTDLEAMRNDLAYPCHTTNCMHKKAPP